MALVIIGVLLVLAHWAGIGPVADWPWWYFVLPFVAAVGWWAWSDASGLTQRRAMRKMEERKEERRRRTLEQLGLGPQRAASAGAKPRTRESGAREPRS